jgi:glutamate-ammonia-ligase adenylyltransferase
VSTAAPPGIAAARGLMLAHSPFLRRLLEADPERDARLSAVPPDVSHRDIVARQRGISVAFRAGAIDAAGVMRQLRVNRAEHALLVALADIAGLWSVEAVTWALTEFADASVESAVQIALAEAAASGRLQPAASDDLGRGLAVLALGKHGAGELNYSSDIDIVVFFDPETVPVAGSAEPSVVYARLAQRVAKLLSERTSDGYVHRVDYRLRPDPGSTPVAVSLPAAYAYYENVGQNWERAAYIKARPVAGDLQRGASFIQDLAPFIWRKYFDFASIADIHAMKRQIHAVRGHGELAIEGHDIKLGRGGIREIEFFVQTQQLVYGGRRPALRGARTLEMLHALHAEGWITAQARDELAVAYRFLRTVEHRLQMVADEQTQRIPVNADEVDSFVRFCGFADRDGFAAALTAHARCVQEHYALLFEASPELAVEAGDLVFTGPDDDPATLATLGRLGFRDPPTAAETVRGWHFGRRAAVRSARAREVLTDLTPALLSALGDTADPDGALARLDRAFARMPAAVELMTILRSHAELRRLFADLLGAAPRLADVVAEAPHVLDALIDPAFTRPDRNGQGLADDLGRIVGRPADTEEFLDRLRDGVRQLQFAVGARVLSRVTAPREAGRAFADIAQAAIGLSLGWAEAAFQAEHGTVLGGRIAILGLGRLGARDLTASSDLDLVAIYDFDEAGRSSSGPKVLDADGVLYPAHAAPHRCPDGRDAARATLRRRSSAASLRLQGTCRDTNGRLSRLPCGPGRAMGASGAHARPDHGREREFGCRDLGHDRRGALGNARSCVGLPRSSRHARPRFARERQRECVGPQAGEGGLLELDFIAQALTLAEAERHPGLVGLPDDELFAAAARAGLLSTSDADLLGQAFRTMNDVQHLQCLTLGPNERENGTPSNLDRLAKLVGLPEAVSLRAELDEHRRGVREVFDRVLRPHSGAPSA